MRKLANEELQRISPEAYESAEKKPVILVLDNVRSLNNIGSIFRTGDGFRVEKIVLCGISTCPPHRDIHKTALGAELAVPWEYFEESTLAIAELKRRGYYVMAVEQAEGSTQLPELDLSGKNSIAFVFGHEVKGVDQAVVNLCDECLEIPQFGTKHSFNVSVSVGIVLWEAFRKMKPS